MLRHVDNKHPIVASCWFSLSSHFAHDARSQEPKGMAVLYKRILRAGMSFVKVGWMTLYLGGKWLPVIFIFLEPVRWNLIVVISPPCCWVLMGFAKIDVTYTILHFWGRIKFWPLSTIFSWLLDKIQYSRFTHTHTHTQNIEWLWLSWKLVQWKWCFTLGAYEFPCFPHFSPGIGETFNHKTFCK